MLTVCQNETLDVSKTTKQLVSQESCTMIMTSYNTDVDITCRASSIIQTLNTPALRLDWLPAIPLLALLNRPSSRPDCEAPTLRSLRKLGMPPKPAPTALSFISPEPLMLSKSDTCCS